MSGTDTFKEMLFVSVKTWGHNFGYLFGKPVRLIVKFWELANEA